MSHKTHFAVAFAAAIAFGYAGSAGAQDCANPTPLPSISLTPPFQGFAGATDATATLGFGALPNDCHTWVRFESTNYQAANPGFHNSFRGAGPHTMAVRTFAVNATTVVTISAFTKAGIGATPQVGPTRTATMTLLPLPLKAFSINTSSIERTETATGRVELGGSTGGLDGLARVNLSSDPAGKVTIPAFVDVGDQATPVPGGFTEYVSTFTVSPRSVNEETVVTITAARAGETRTDTIRVMPDCRLTVQMSTQDTATQDRIRVLITNIGTSQCPRSGMGVRMFTPNGRTTELQGFNLLDFLEPNEQVEASFTWEPVAGSGARTFQFHCCSHFHPGIAATSPSLILSLTKEQVNAAAAN